MDNPLDKSMYRGGGANDFVRGLPFVGDMFGGLGVETAAEVNKKRAMQRMMELMAQYRPEQLETRQNALDNAMKLFTPVNRALTKAYGSGAALPIEQATQSPFSDQAMAGMKAAAATKNPPYFPASEQWMEGKPKPHGR